MIFYVRLCDSSQVKFSVEVPTSIIQECYQLTLQEYAKRFKVPFLCKRLHPNQISEYIIAHKVDCVTKFTTLSKVLGVTSKVTGTGSGVLQSCLNLGGHA